MNSKNTFGKKIYSKKTIDYAKTKVSLLGSNTKYNEINLLNIRLISLCLIFFVLLYTLDFGYFIAPIVAFLYYTFFFRIFIDPKIRKRQEVLEKDALYFFKVLGLSLEAGRNIKTAIEVTTNNIESELSDEFKRLLKDVNFGKNLNEALDDMKKRIPSDSINNIILSIREANVFGNNVVDALYAQVEYIRERKIMNAKAEISKIPVKISVISVIFFIPLLLLILLGPMLIKLLS